MTDPHVHEPPAAAPAMRFRLSDAALIVYKPDGTEAKPSVRLIVDREGYIGVVFTDSSAPVFGYTFWISEKAIELTRADGRPSNSLE